MLPQCLDQGVGVVPWSPLARGVLARTREAYDDKPTPRSESDGFTPYLYDEAALEIVDRVGQVADQVGASRSQVALAWVMRNPAVTAPIVGATKMEHLEQALGALDVVLSDEQVARLEEPYVPREVRGHS